MTSSFGFAFLTVLIPRELSIVITGFLNVYDSLVITFFVQRVICVTIASLGADSKVSSVFVFVSGVPLLYWDQEIYLSLIDTIVKFA
jgi:hypothetical protein